MLCKPEALTLICLLSMGVTRLSRAARFQFALFTKQPATCWDARGVFNPHRHVQSGAAHLLENLPELLLRQLDFCSGSTLG